MIVSMKKVFVAVRREDQGRVLDVLRDLGLVHLEPVDPGKAVAKSETLSRLDHLGRAIQILSGISPHPGTGETSETDTSGPIEAADEVLAIQRETAEKTARLSVLTRQMEQLEVWGDVRMEQFDELRQIGVDLEFYAADDEHLSGFDADLVQVICQLPGKRHLVGVAVRDRAASIPEGVELLELPGTDRPTVRTEAQQIDRRLKDLSGRLSVLTGKLPEMVETQKQLRSEADYTVARRGGCTNGDLFAVQGWVPAATGDTLASKVSESGVGALVQVYDPAEDEDPPTLIRYPRWAWPIKALFDMLGTIPGFREFDLSGFFMIAMPIFVAMLIGDAGYGLLFVAGGLLFRRRLVEKIGVPATYLILIFGAMTIVWGVLTANYFGVTPETIARIAGFTQTGGQQGLGDVAGMLRSEAGGWTALGKTMFRIGPLYRTDPEKARNIVMKISFILGCLHLIAGQLRQAVGKYPDIRFLSNVGWAIVLPGMLGVVWQMFFVGIENPWGEWIFVCIALGFAMVIFFSYPSRNPLKMLSLGILANVMPLINTFSDTMSYIRLMAVGLASYYIAYSFNLLGTQVAEGSHWILAIPVLLFGHGLNIALGVIAVFAHGVRLNMLEFSNNAGVQWSGHAYRPFAKTFSDNIKET